MRISRTCFAFWARNAAAALVEHFGLPKERDYTDVERVRITAERPEEG